MMLKSSCPILGFVAYSGTGKTTLLKKLIPLLNQKNIQVGMIKHAHHNFDIDVPGKDSYELRKAGAKQMLVASSQRWALMTETSGQAEARLDVLIEKLDTSQLDLVLVEGFKHVHYTKIECHRPSLGHDLMCLEDKSIIALATDQTPAVDVEIPLLDLNQPDEMVNFIQNEILEKQ
jgi:molybdopterin-guanine dinucleotide biosynthesis protein B